VLHHCRFFLETQCSDCTHKIVCVCVCVCACAGAPFYFVFFSTVNKMLNLGLCISCVSRTESEKSRVVSLCAIGTCIHVCVWLGGVMVTVLDLRCPAMPLLGINLGQVVHTRHQAV